MLHENDRSGKLAREAWSETHNRRWSSGRSSQDHNRKTLIEARVGRQAGRGGSNAAVRAPSPLDFCTWNASREAVRTTRTFAAMRTLRNKSSFTLCISRSMPLEGLATNSIAPSSSAFSVLAAPSLRFGADDHDRPGIRGHYLRCGLQAVHVRHVDVHGDDVGLERFSEATASRPSLARPATWN